MMSALTTGWIAFACIFGGSLVGMTLGAVLPERHLSQESKDVVKLGMGLLATMAALVLSLLLASAKSTYDTKNKELEEIAANTLLLDRVLAHYGPETQDARALVRKAVEKALHATWPEDGAEPPRLDAPGTIPVIEVVQDEIRALVPRTDAQRWLQSRALQVSGDVAQMRWLVFGSTGSSIPGPFLVALVFWVAAIFGSFGLFAPRNATVVGVLLVCALSVAMSLVLILEMDQPLAGWLKVSSGPLRYTLAHLGQ